MKKTDEDKQRERRRLRGARLLQRGLTQAEVARRLKVTRATVHAWNRRLEAGGLEALRRRKRGRPPRLDAAQRARLAAALKRGARAAGYATELWTLARIGRLIGSLFGVSYSDSQVWRILKHMGWSCQRPEKRALQRDEQAIRRWKRERWPRLKKTPNPRAALSSS